MGALPVGILPVEISPVSIVAVVAEHRIVSVFELASLQTPLEDLR